MGVVRKAIDTTLDREVAVKLLPETFAANADRLARFEREARVLASLNHPNIASIFGLHAVGQVHFLAMELVAGNPELIIPVEGRPYGPRLLPDGDSVLFTVTPTPDWDTAQIVSQSLSTGERTVPVEGGDR
jgi:serine/threonine protein kinase